MQAGREARCFWLRHFGSACFMLMMLLILMMMMVVVVMVRDDGDEFDAVFQGWMW